MKIEKAIEILKEQYTTVSKCLSIKEATEQNTAINLAISALEKQIPKKVIRVSNNRTDGCSECYVEFYEKFNYCPNCGQKLDWEVENEISAERNS